MWVRAYRGSVRERKKYSGISRCRAFHAFAAGLGRVLNSPRRPNSTFRFRAFGFESRGAHSGTGTFPTPTWLFPMLGCAARDLRARGPTAARTIHIGPSISVGERPRDRGRSETSGGKWVRESNSHEVAASDACCCAVRWETFFGLQFQMDWVGRVIALS